LNWARSWKAAWASNSILLNTSNGITDPCDPYSRSPLPG
jgi:hypothetical protein